MAKLRNKTKRRQATANEIAKAIMIDKLENFFYFADNDEYGDNYDDDFMQEISRHMLKHVRAIEKRLNPHNDNIEIYY
tara:strand:- start:175 stop:408 length:234 start_codon:yes stop_codon:yes gene_type:complete